MFLRHIFMAGLATACGIAVSAGTFAFLLVIGVIPRMIKRCNFGERILMVENTVILGVLTGAVFSVVEWKAQLPYPWLAHVILGAYGTSGRVHSSRKESQKRVNLSTRYLREYRCNG